MSRQVPRSRTTASDILRQTRRRERLTQQQLAQRAGVSKTVIGRYESGQQQPSLVALERLVAACGYELEWSLRQAPGLADGGIHVDRAERGLTDGALEVKTIAGISGPIGQRIALQLDDVLAALARTGGTLPRVYGEVANGTETEYSRVVIGLTLPPSASPLSMTIASGFIALIINADVSVVQHTDVAGYGCDDDGVALVQTLGSSR